MIIRGLEIDIETYNEWEKWIKRKVKSGIYIEGQQDEFVGFLKLKGKYKPVRATSSVV